MLQIYGHPFSSYTWKALIPLYENGTPFEFCMIDGDHPENIGVLQANSPQGKFPLLLDNGRAVFESTSIIEYLQEYHPGAVRLIPQDFDRALDVRTMDRFFDNYVMGAAQAIVNDFLRDPEHRDPLAVEQATAMLLRAYQWLDSRMQGKVFACGDSFTLADCAAAPSLFYADWLCEIAPQWANLRNYRSRLLSRPSVTRCVDDARPYRAFFPAGAPDRD